VIDKEAWLDAWNGNSAQPIVDTTDPEVEVHAVTLGIEGRHYKGHDGVRQWMRDIRDRFGARTVADSVEEIDENVVIVRGTLFIKDGFGGEDEQRFAMVVHLRDGKALWMGTFFSSADAKAAYVAGLTGPQLGKN
jgi:ketosteroid isomerase-like protein